MVKGIAYLYPSIHPSLYSEQSIALAPMQVAHLRKYLNGNPTSNELVNGVDLQLHKEAASSKHLMHNAEETDCCPVGVASGTKSSTIARYLKLKWRKYDSLASRVGGSEYIFRKIFGDEAENTFWLDSSSTEKVICFFFLLIFTRRRKVNFFFVFAAALCQ